MFFQPAEFWGLRPHNWPEISVGPKKCVFLALGDLPPFVFMDNDKIQKKIFFYLRYVHVHYNQLVQFWFHSSWLHKILIWWPRWCHKNAFFDQKNFDAEFSHFLVTNFLGKICDKKVTKFCSKKFFCQKIHFCGAKTGKQINIDNHDTHHNVWTMLLFVRNVKSQINLQFLFFIFYFWFIWFFTFLTNKSMFQTLLFRIMIFCITFWYVAS